jgi:TPR repeat protein
MLWPWLTMKPPPVSLSMRLLSRDLVAAVGLAGLLAAGAAPRACGVTLTSAAPPTAAAVAPLRGSTAPADVYRLALAYVTGGAIPQDCKAAATMLATAAAAHYPPAANALGEMYEAGQGVPQNDRLAAKWFRDAYDHGDARGTFNFGRVMAEGKAFDYATVAVSTSNGDFARAGTLQASSTADWNEVAKIWSTAADEGDPLAAYDLAQLYENGAEGVAVDLDRALNFYRIAAQAGVSGAQQRVDALQHRR